MNLKKAIRKLHLWLGLGAGVIILIVAITGCLYSFEEEITNYTQQDFNVVKLENVSHVPLNKIVDAYKKKYGEDNLLFIKQKEIAPNATIVLGNKKQQVAYNPYNGKEVTILKSSSSFFAIVLDIHRTLLLGDIGKEIIGITAFVFLFMLISGLILWLPTSSKKLKSFFTINNKSSKRLNFDLHRVGGFYASFILIFIVCTGLFFAYDFVKKAAFAVTASEAYTKWGPDSESKENRKINIGQVYNWTQTEFPNCIESTIYYPKEKEGSIRIKLKYAYQYVPKYNTIFVDQFSGKILQVDLNKNATLAEHVKNSILGIHTGSIFGIFGKIIVFLAVLIAASLPITGFLIWNKKQKRENKKSLRSFK
jgi:uncharacterized iron-regulated membrane protein